MVSLPQSTFSTLINSALALASMKSFLEYDAAKLEISRVLERIFHHQDNAK